MEEKLSQGDLKFLKEGIDFNQKGGAMILKRGAITLIFTIILFFILGLSIRELALVCLFLMVINVCIWYTVFGQAVIKLKQDIASGVKNIEKATVKKITKRKDGNEYLLSNKFKISDTVLEVEEIENIHIGQELMISYTPYRKMILSMKESR